jgi:membrane dipeptidase
MTLTHSFHTDWADSSGTRSDVPPRHHGLAPFGEQVVKEMNRLGMMVDISHVSDETFWDVLEVTQAPVIASHSSARAVADHRRNLSDEMLRALAENGGVLMVNFYSAYLDEQAARETTEYYARWSQVYQEIAEKHADDPTGRRYAYWAQSAAHPPPRTSLAVLLDHFDHVVRVAGPDHVGLGADWDGVASMPEGMEDVSQLPALTRGLLARGHSPETVRKILGENLLRVMREAERVAERLRGPPRPGP